MHPTGPCPQQDPPREQRQQTTLYASLELSRSTWLVTSLAPGDRKMSKHSVAAGDGAALLAVLRLRPPLGPGPRAGRLARHAAEAAGPPTGVPGLRRARAGATGRAAALLVRRRDPGRQALRQAPPENRPQKAPRGPARGPGTADPGREKKSPFPRRTPVPGLPRPPGGPPATLDRGEALAALAPGCPWRGHPQLKVGPDHPLVSKPDIRRTYGHSGPISQSI